MTKHKQAKDVESQMDTRRLKTPAAGPAVILILIVASLALIWIRISADGVVLETPKPLPAQLWHRSLFEDEDFDTLLANLNDPSDFAFASSSFSETLQKRHGVLYRKIPAMGRIRKITSLIEENPALMDEAAVNLFESRIRDSVEMFPALFQGIAQAYFAKDPEVREAARKIRNVGTEDNPSIGHRMFTARIFGQTAVYLLAHCRKHESLPVLVRAYRLGEKEWIMTPIPKAFLFAAMDCLVRTHPKAELSESALKALEEYKKMVQYLPSFEMVKLPSWNSDFNELDFRYQIAHEPLPLGDQPTVKVTYFAAWPAKYEETVTGYLYEDKGTVRPIAEDENGLYRKELRPYFEALARFVDIAYPAVH